MGFLKSAKHWVFFAAVASSALALGPPVVADENGAAGGLAWLRSSQREDGLWGWDDRLAVRDSVEVLRAFEALAPSDPILSAAREVLASQAPATVDLEARLVEALRPTISEAILSVAMGELLAMRSRDGGWGITAGYETSDALDTALALRALVSTTSLGANELLAAVNRLIALQNADGGFGAANGELSDLKTSAEVLRAVAAISRIGAVDALSQSLVQFLLGQQQADGGFPAFAGADTSDVRSTALVVLALVEAGADMAVQYPAARGYLLANQLPDGSWEESAYTTALASAALAGTLPDLMISKAEFTPSTTPRGPDVSLSISVANLGLADASDASVSVYLGDPASGGVLQGSKTIPALQAGGIHTFTMTISTLLTIEMSLAYYVVADAEKKIREACETNNRKVAILEITDSPPPMGLVHPPTISSKPPIRAVVGTVYTYQIVATDPAGDVVWYNSLYGPAGMSVDIYTGLVTWPVNVPAGTRVTMEIGALDFNYAGTPQAWSVDVVEPGTTWPPTIDTVPSSAAVVGQPYLYALDGTDPDGGPLSYTVLSGPSGMVLNPATNVISWTPTSGDVGDTIVRVMATDTQNETTQQEWTIVVDPASTLKPDLVPLAIDLLESPTDAQTLHRDGAIVVTVANQGTADTTTFDVIVYEERDGQSGYEAGGDRLLGRTTVSSLAKGERTDAVVPVSGDVLFRDNRVAVYVDPENLVEESHEDNNGDLSGNGTRFTTVPGPFRASLKWKADRVAMSGLEFPLAVAQLNDDNGDGKIDRNDTPDIIGLGSYDSKASSHNGKTGALQWQVSIDGYGYTPTVADTDGDGSPEIFFVGSYQTSSATVNGVIALNADGSLRWGSGSLINAAMKAGGLSSTAGEVNVADLDADGRVEIVARTAIVENDGVVRCHFPLTSDLPNIVADIDGDGKQEVVALPYVFRSDCTVLWAHPEWQMNCRGSAIAQLDSDPEPEIVLSRTDGVWVVEHNGVVKWKKSTPSGYWTGNTTPVSLPAVGDVDGDGQPEIVVNDRFRIGVYEPDGTMRWVAGQFTAEPFGEGPALADLDGDGALEVIMNDDTLLRVWRGKNGTELFTYANLNSSNGVPAIADVDGDGHLEIIVGELNGSSYAGGVRVFGNANWAPGRGLWNQPRSYHVTNILDDQGVPVHEIPSWQAHNTYQAQVSVSHTVCEECGDTGESADLTASYIRVDSSACPAQTTYKVRVGNGGGRGVGSGVKVRFAQVTQGISSTIGDVLTSRALGSGEYQDVTITTSGGTNTIQLVVTVDPDQNIADAKRENNVHGYSFIPCSQYDDLPPRFASSPPLTAVVGTNWVYYPQAVDPDGDVVTYQVTQGPSGLTGPKTNGAVVWVPTSDQLGLQEVSIEASDGRGGKDVQLFMVEVKAPPLSAAPTPAEASNLVLAVTTDKQSYGPGETGTVNASVQNQSQAGRAGSLKIEVQDETGLALVSVLAAQTLVFTGPGTQAKSGSLGTGVLLPGSYKVVAIYTEGGSESRATAAFAVTGSPTLSVSVVTGHSQYGANETVRVSGQMQNGSPNAPLLGIVPKLIVLNGSSSVVAEQEFAVADLGPSGLQRVELLFDTALHAPGDYRALLEVRQSGSLAGTAESHFTIVSSASRGLSMSGDIACNPTPVMPGGSFVLIGVMANVGNAALSGLDVRLQVLDPTTRQIVREQPSAADLAMGANGSVEATFSSVGLLPKSYIGRLEVSLAGRSLLSVATEVLLDSGSPPAVTIQTPSCGTADVTPVISVSGGFPPITQVAFLDQQPYSGGMVSVEGAHDLEVQVTDAIGRTAQAAASFIIDRTAPVVTISGVSDGGAFRSPAVPVIGYADSNGAQGSATLNGLPFASGTAVTVDGMYVLVATAMDCAGNTGQAGASFLLDSVPPVVSINGAPGCSQGPANPVVAASDAAEPDVPPTRSCWLDGQPLVSCDGISIGSEGEHQVEASAVDRAGNQSLVVHASFIVDKTAPQVQIQGVAEGGAYNHAVTPVIVASDAHLGSQQATLNGAPFVSGTPVSSDGTYVLEARAQDCAGNQGGASAHFVVDTEAPRIVIDVPACAAGLVTPVITVTEAHVAKDERLLDGQPYDNGGVTAEGRHTLKVTVTDTAGNVTAESVDFVVDNTAPTIALSGVESGRAYNQAVTPVVVFQDAVEITLLLNGRPFTSGTEVSEDGDYILAATAKDCAGNRADLNATFQVDQVAPAVTIDVGACQEGPVTPVVTVTDAHLASDERSLDGQPWDGTPIAAEGTHVLQVVATDTAGNRTEREASFVVDNTPPAIAVAGVADGGWYATPVTPVVSITETNLTGSTMTLDDQPYLSETPVSTEGSHLLVVTATDCAGHTAMKPTGFGLDFTAPNLVLGNVPACTAQDVTPAVGADEPVTLVETLDGMPYEPGVPIVVEGSHQLSVEATDRAGNTSSLAASFIIDRTPPQLDFLNVADGAAYNVPVSPFVNANDPNLDFLSSTLDGQPFANGTVVSNDGWHTLSATATDCAGHAVSAGATFLIDKMNPVVAIAAPACSPGPVTPQITVVEANLTAQTQTLDGASYSGGPVSQEGGHDLAVVAIDKAGNQGSATAHFIIDKTPPALSIGGVQDGTTYSSPVTPIISASDPNLVSTTATLNGLPFVSGTEVSLDGSHTLVAVATDCAGNQASQTVHFQIQSIAGTITQDLYYGSRTLLANEHAGTGGPQLLRSVLTEAEIPWEEATTRTEWLGKLRSGRFNQVVLYKPGVIDSGSYLPELNEATWIGDGLIVIKDATHPLTPLRESEGLDFSSMALRPTSLTLLSPLQPATVSMSGTAVKLQLMTAVSVGRPQGDSRSIVAALGGRGLGETLTLAWDTETSASRTLYQSALSASAPPSGVPLLAGGTTRLRTTVHNPSSIETQYTLVHTLSSGLCTKDPLQYTIVVPGGGAREQILTVHLPVAAGNYTLTSQLSAAGRLLDEKTFTFAITLTTGALRSQAVSGLQGLSLTGTSAQKRDQAVALLAQAAQAATPLDAVGLVWRAIDAVRGITSVNVTANRIDLARLLRSYEMATGGSGVSANLDGLPCFAYGVTAASTCSKSPPAPISGSGCITINAATMVDSYSHSEGPYGGGNKHNGDLAMRCNDRAHDSNNTCSDNCGSACVSGSIQYLVDLHYTAIAEPPSVANSTKVYVNSGQSVTFDAAGGVAFYDTVVLNSGGTLKLKTGSYIVKDLQLNSNGTLKADGVVRVWTRNAPSLNTGATITSNNPRDFWLIYNGSGTINNNSGSKFYGVLFAPLAKVNLNYEVFGAVVAGGATLNSGAKVHYDTDLTCPSGGGSNPDGGTPPGDCTSIPGASF